MLKGPANHGSATISPVMNFGPGFVTNWLSDLNRESREMVLDELKRPAARAAYESLRLRLEGSLVQALKLEGIDNAFIHHVRIQILSTCSILAALEDQGRQHEEGNHPLLAAETTEEETE